MTNIKKRNKYDEKFKTKIYLTHDEKQNVKNASNNENCENYNQLQNLAYFDSNYNNKFDDFETIVLTITMKFLC